MTVYHVSGDAVLQHLWRVSDGLVYHSNTKRLRDTVYHRASLDFNYSVLYIVGSMSM